MTISEFTIKQGDTRESIAATLNDSETTPFTLSGATVAFNMRSIKTNTLIIDHAVAVIVDATTRRVRYDWQVGDTATAGDYRAEFEVTFAPDDIATFPNSRENDLIVHIIEQVG